MEDVQVITGRYVPSHIIIETAGIGTIRAATQGDSDSRLSGREMPVTSSRVLYVLNVEHSLISVSSLYDNNHTVVFMNHKQVMKKDSCVVGIRQRAGGMYFVNLQLASERARTISDNSRATLSVWHARLAHADWNATENMAQGVASHGLDLTEARSTNGCLLYVQEAVLNTPMRSQTTLEARPDAVLLTEAAEMNASSVDGSQCFCHIHPRNAWACQPVIYEAETGSCRVVEPTCVLG